MSGRLLLAYDAASTFVPTTVEYLESFARYSQWDVRYLHITHEADFPFDFNEFDAIFHSYSARLIIDGYVSTSYLDRLEAFRGVKMLSVQDEYDQTDKLKRRIGDLGFHVVLTCVPDDMIERVYPRVAFPGTEFANVLTGYVPEHLLARAMRPLAERPIQIGYRGRDIGGRYGRLGFLKLEIGRRMRQACEAHGICHDIEWSEAKRIYGEAWYDFLASCRATLGSESGSDVFDFDGSIEAIFNRMSAERGGPVPYGEFRAYTDPIERQYQMGQISPRVFEAAALRTPLILLSGRYSGLIEPETHYIELKEDFSNIDAVLARLDDLDGLQAMADRAYAHLIASGRYDYRHFVRIVGDLLRRKATEIGMPLRSALPRHIESDAGVNPAEIASLDERPTAKPGHFLLVRYKRAALELARVQNELTRTSSYHAEDVRLLKAELAQASEYHAEDVRLLKAELARVYEFHAEDVARLTAEAAGLKSEIARLTAEITRLNAALAEVWLWRRLKRALRDATILIGSRLGQYLLVRALLPRRCNYRLLAQAARVLAFTRARARKLAVIVPVLSDGELRLNAALAQGNAETKQEPLSASDLVAALEAGRVERCVLVTDAVVGLKEFAAEERRRELPDLLSWLKERPQWALRLIEATMGRAAERPMTENAPPVAGMTGTLDAH